MTRGDLAEAIGLLERSLGGVVKALLESGVGQSGTVAALSIDDFVLKVKSAFECVTCNASVPLGVGDVPSGGALPAGASSPVHVPGSPSGSRVGASSHVPSVFGADSSVAGGNVQAATSSSSKPGKNLLRSCGGF